MKKLIIIFIIFIQPASAIDFKVVGGEKQPFIAGAHSIGDLNGDGYMDMFVSGMLVVKPFTGICSLYCPPIVSIHEVPKVLINNQKGGFSALEQYNDFDFYPEVIVGTDANTIPGLLENIEQLSPYFSEIADLDNDGDNDIITSNGRVFLNDGAGNFGNHLLPGYFANNSKPIFTADFNNDGVLEIISAGRIFERTSLQPLQYAETVNSFKLDINSNIEIADFDNDGFVDVLSYSEEDEIKILFNNRHGSFSNANIVSLSFLEPIKLIIGDVDNDNYIDIVLSNGSILKNLQNKEFEVVENILSITNTILNNDSELDFIPRKLIKYNNDDYLDMHVTVENDGNYNDLVLINDTTGKFHISIEQFRSVNINSTSLYGFYKSGITSFSGDFNADSFEDFITLNTNPFTGYSDFSGFNPINLSFYNDFSIFPRELNLYINDGTGNIGATNFNKAPYSKISLVNFDNNEVKDILYTSYDSEFDNMSVELSDQLFYRPNFSHKNAHFKEIKLQKCSDESWISHVLPLDINNDNLDDLIVFEEDFSEECFRSKSVFVNTGNGFVKNENINLDNVDVSYLYYNISVLDFNGDGFDDLFNRYDYKLYINDHGNGYSAGIELIDFQYISEIVDINGDGKSDVSYIDENSKIHVIYGNEDPNQIVDSQLSNIPSRAISFFDYDSDGLMDLYIKGLSDVQISKLKNSNGDFNLIEIYALPQSLEYGKFKAVDINHDGKIEIIQDAVYQLDSDNNFEKINSESGQTNYLLGDFDGDALTDISFGNMVLYSRNFSFYTGLSFDPSHSGHGFSIENVGEDQFFTVFYTYDNEGNPEWYTNLGMFQQPRDDYWNIRSDDYYGLVRTEYDYVNNVTVQNTSNSYKGSLYHDRCSTTFSEINIYYEIGVNSFGIPLSKDRWCSQPIVDYYQRPQEDFSGLWWAGGDDSGWGWSISLVERDETTDLVLVLYYYDALGNPRWLIGQQSGFVKGQEITLDMNRVKGYGRGYTPTDLTFISAGTITLTLNEVSNNLSKAGVMSIDVSYPGPEGGNWVRNNIPIALFSKPRN